MAQRCVPAADNNSVIRRSFLRTSLTTALVGAGVVGRWWWRRLPAPGDGVRVATWNLRNFPRDPEDHDLATMRAQIDAVAPDVLALQEVLDPAALDELVPGYAVVSSAGGGHAGQRLSVAVRRPWGVAGPPIEDAAVGLDGELRPALAVPVEAPGHGRLSVVNVHLKARGDGLPIRRAQWPALAALLRRLPSPRLVLGDFNATGGAAEIEEIGTTLRDLDLVVLETVGNCTAYWGGVRHDAWLEPSRLDLIWAPAASVKSRPTAFVNGPCRRHGCEPFRSSEAYPDHDLDRASDHCLVAADLATPVQSSRDVDP